MERTGSHQYANGNKYSGTWRAGLVNGKGTLNFENGDVYVGEWKEGTMHGKVLKGEEEFFF